MLGLILLLKRILLIAASVYKSWMVTSNLGIWWYKESWLVMLGILNWLIKVEKPCLCLCLGLVRQMTYLIVPFLMIWQWGHIFLIAERTFILSRDFVYFFCAFLKMNVIDVRIKMKGNTKMLWIYIENKMKNCVRVYSKSSDKASEFVSSIFERFRWMKKERK